MWFFSLGLNSCGQDINPNKQTSFMLHFRAAIFQIHLKASFCLLFYQYPPHTSKNEDALENRRKSFTDHGRIEWSATVESSRGTPQKHPEWPSHPAILFLCYKPRTEQRAQGMHNSHSQQSYSQSPKGKDDLLSTGIWREHTWRTVWQL